MSGNGFFRQALGTGRNEFPGGYLLGSVADGSFHSQDDLLLA